MARTMTHYAPLDARESWD